MQEGNKKEKWGKPKLIILIRGKPDEIVLMGCKGQSTFTGQWNQYGLCIRCGGCITGNEPCVGTCDMTTTS
jgi:hypothetical protein